MQGSQKIGNLAIAVFAEHLTKIQRHVHTWMHAGVHGYIHTCVPADKHALVLPNGITTVHTSYARLKQKLLSKVGNTAVCCNEHKYGHRQEALTNRYLHRTER